MAGTVQIPIEYDSADTYFMDGKVSVKKGDRSFKINVQGKEVSP
jgi:hypothetical protein